MCLALTCVIQMRRHVSYLSASRMRRISCMSASCLPYECVMFPTQHSTVHDESWDDEHQHLHPDRLVMQKDFITHTLFEIFQGKPILRDIPGIANSTSFITFANDSHLEPHLRDNYEWEEYVFLCFFPGVFWAQFSHP